MTRRTIATLLAVAIGALACGSGDPDAGDPTSQAPADSSDDDDAEADADDEVGEDGVAADRADLLGAGATFITPVMLEWIRDNEPGIAVNYQSIGSGGGIAQFLEESVDFGSTERYLTDEEVEDAQEIRGCEAIHIPDAFGGVVPAYNSPDVEAALDAAGQDALIVSGDVLAGIYLGDIDRWDDPALAELNPDVELPDGDIIPVHRSDGSGTTYIFVTYLSSVNQQWADEVGAGSEVDWPAGIGGNGNEGVAAETQQQPGAVGYLSIAYAIENDISMMAVINEDGVPVYPTVESVSAGPASIIDTIPEDFRYDITGVGGDGFPIVGTHWILAWECGYDDETASSLIDFLTWVIEDGDDLAIDLLYSPTSGPFKDRVLEQIQRINAAD